MSKSVQEMNFIFFLIGSLGIYQLLKIFEYNKIQILTSIILVNFLPISVAQRMVFKTRNICFCITTLVSGCIRKFILTKNMKYLFISIPFFISLVSQKGSIFAMVTIFIFLFYLPRIYVHISKKNIKFFFSYY